MELAKSFEPHAIEAKWYPLWESRGYFKPSMREGASAFCIQLPPPNVTGTLHMGHAFQQTLMDVLIRYHRMRGENTLWQLGTDHAGIATQIVVENQLKAEGRSREELGRERFVERVWAWKQESGSTITNQMRRLGTSGDWSRERFTMDPGLSAAVLETFVRLYEDGLIYRGKRLVNWDPKLGTAVSDLEVESEEEQGKLWEIRYPRVDGQGDVVVATTRPETMLGDVAVAVNPDDERYRSLVGLTVTLPLTGRTIPVIADDYVDREFGTGCVKITPAHDFNDWQIGQRHGLAPIPILALDATINDNAPAKYRGLDRYAARAAVLADLAAHGFLVSEKPHRMVVPRCGRTGEVVEPMLTDQWFVATRTPSPATHPFFPGRTIQDLCLAAVGDGLASPRDGAKGRVDFVPDQWLHTYLHWINNIQDWCISRQLWWGHRIPAWYDDAGNVYVARDEAAARAQARAKLGREPATLEQDPDVLDTWFSSALWCHSTLGWPEPTRELATFLPSSVLVTGFDIIFFWVARMIMTTTYFTGEVPFRERVHQCDRARRGRPEDVEVEGQRARPARPDRRDHGRRPGGKADVRPPARETARADREAHAQAVPERHPVVRRRRRPLHVREPCHLRPHAQFRLEPLRGLSQLLQQAVERRALRADERRWPRCRARCRRCRLRFRRPTAGSSRACSRRRRKSPRSSTNTASTLPRRRSTNSSGTSTATGISSSRKPISRAGTKRRSGARAARSSASSR